MESALQGKRFYNDFRKRNMRVRVDVQSIALTFDTFPLMSRFVVSNY